MGMHFTACNCHVVSEDFIKKICPNEWNDFNDALLNQETYSESEAVYELTFGECEDEPALDDAYENLVSAFKKKTAQMSKGEGLDLTIGFHSKEDCGDADDDVDGIFWSIDFDSIFTYTPTGEFFKDEIHPARFVEYG